MKCTIDRAGVLSNSRRTATGGYLVDATLAKVGVMLYADESGKPVRHYNPPEVLQSALDGLATAPVTNRHPAQFVSPETYQKVAAGHVVGTAAFEDGHVKATLAINDAALIRDIELGVCREVSMGYMVDTAPAEVADEYDVVRTKIEWNHVAIVPSGRAGKSVRLLLDSNEIPNQDEVKVALKINGAEVADDKAQAAIDSLEGQLVAVSKERDALKAAKDTADAALAAATSDAAVDAAVAARLDREAKAKARQDKLDRVKAGYPDVAVDGKSDDYIDALDVALAKLKAADPDGLKQIKNDSPGGKNEQTDAAPVLSAREEMLARQRKPFLQA
jgi:hypothetical protein